MLLFRFCRFGGVHCRVGSLENEAAAEAEHEAVHCRVGSLENCNVRYEGGWCVHCRVGSLETGILGKFF